MKNEKCPFDNIPESETAYFYAFIQPIDTQQSVYPYTVTKTLYMSMFNVTNTDPMRLYFDSFSCVNPKSIGTVIVRFTSATMYSIDAIQLIIGNDLTYERFVIHSKALNNGLNDIIMLNITSNI